MFKDILGQAWEAMLYNRRRTAITMVGMAWGIATVVLLLAYGAGFTRALEAIFAEWGTHTIGVFPGRTSEQTWTAPPPESPESAISRPRCTRTFPCRTICTTTPGA